MAQDNKIKFLKRRILLDLILLFGVFLLPLWLEFIIVFVMMFYFDNYLESIFFAIFADSVYSVPLNFLPLPIFYTLITSIGYAVVTLLKRSLRTSL